MLKFFINILFLVSLSPLLAQQDSLKTTHNNLSNPADSLIARKPVKIRLGWDIGKFIWAKLQDSQSLDFSVGLRFYKNYSLVLEGGNEDHLTDTSLMTYHTRGNYFKLGIDYNLYDNWLDMNNEINIGFRYARAHFDYLLNRYRTNQPGAIYTPQIIEVNQAFEKVNAGWFEITTNIQVEIWHHFYIGYALSLKYLLSYQNPENFEVTYIPGFFERNTYSNFGFGMGYFISYQFRY